MRKKRYRLFKILICISLIYMCVSLRKNEKEKVMWMAADYSYFNDNVDWENDGVVEEEHIDEEINETNTEVLSEHIISAQGEIFNRVDLEKYDFARGFYTVPSNTELTEDIFSPKELLEKDLALKKDDTKPQILIFHTHSQEGFANSVEGDTNTTIVGVGDYLTEILTNTYGYNVYHDTTVYDLVDGVLDRSAAYTYAEDNVARILEDNPSIEVVIDLHRDGVADDVHLVAEGNDTNMAKIMFFNGISHNKQGNISYLENPYREDNLAMSYQMYLLGRAYYPGLLRNNYINSYRYCLHMRGRSMLVEAGAQTNTYEEVKAAMVPFANILDRLLSGEKAF